MVKKKSLVMGAGTLGCALAIGFLMQQGGDTLRPEAQATAGPTLEVTDITLTSSQAAPAPAVEPARASALLPDLPVRTLASISPLIPPEADTLPAPLATPEPACDITMNAQSTAGAMVSLSVLAPCLSDERFTLHHNGVMFTDLTDSSGTASLSVPALAQNATFILAFGNGEGAVAKVTVPTLGFYDRIALQSNGPSGLELHALEFGAEYFAEGHVWKDATGDLGRTAEGTGGFLTRLGNPDTLEPRLVEIYSFPSGTAQRDGTVELSVEAEVTAANCGHEVEAQTLEYHNGEIRVQDLTLHVPACDAIGDFLVLKNLLQDLTLASN